MSEATRSGSDQGTDRELEKSLREEVEDLGRLVDEQDRTIAALRDELLRYRAGLGSRLSKRLEKARQRILRIPVVRQICRGVYRALDIWVDEGFVAIFVKARHKAYLAVRGRSPLVEDRDGLPRRIEDQYETWIRQHEAPDRHEAGAAIARFRETPLISVLAVLEGADPARVKGALATLEAQSYERWELCFAISWNARAAVGADLDVLARGEPRLRVGTTQGHMPAWSDAFRLATGGFIGLLGSDDELAPDALFELVKRLDEQPTSDIVYSDEDSIASDGRRSEPFFKPDWSPDLLLSTNYLERFGIFRKALVEEAGGFIADCGRGETYDLVLRVSERTQRIQHVPKILYHRRRSSTTTDAILSRRAASRDECRVIARALARRSRAGRADPVFTRTGPRCYATRFELVRKPLVSIIIPTRDQRQRLETTLDGIWNRTDYERYEVIVVDNRSTEPEAVRYLASLQPRCQVLQWDRQFNYAAINNFGAARASGEQLLFLNNDVEVIHADWLTAMLEHAQRPEVGAVGAKLLYADGRIQHAGVVVGINQGAANAFRRQPGDTIGPQRLADLVRNCSAVTGACMMVPRRVFDEVGGFDEGLLVVLNDVDLCLRIRQLGYDIVYTPHARLYHYEASSRGAGDPPSDRRLFQERWKGVLARCDPYYNPNLTDKHDDWSIKVDLDRES
jgi:O-antigen biosynthesis protein